MGIKKFLEIGLLIISTSIFFTACAEKVAETNNEKTKSKTISDILNESFEYDENRKIYKTKFTIDKVNDANNLVFKFEKLCSDEKGQLIYTSYFINQTFARRNFTNIVNVCEVNNEPYFFIQQSKDTSNIYYAVTTDELHKNNYLNIKHNKQLELEMTKKEFSEKSVIERQEIQRREIAREQKTKSLFSKKDEKTMTFFDSWRSSNNQGACSKKCTDINIKNNGFKTLKEAQNNNWELISRVGDTEEALDDFCTCSGSSVLLKKK